VTFNVVVVGAGSAGAVIASRLSEDESRSVALIEAGPDYPSFDDLPAALKYGYASAADIATDTHLWPYSARATRWQHETPLPRGRVTGGTSAINGQIFARGLPEDFDAWAAQGNEGWSFADVEPVYRQLETDLDFDDEHHGRTGLVQVHRYPRDSWLPPQVAFHEACLAAGYEDCPDMNAPYSSGAGPLPFNNVGGIRASSALTYLAAARGRPNLHVLAETTARRLLVGGSRIRGVEVACGNALDVIEGDEYVLAAGAVGSPHLLLLSGIGPVRDLERAGVRVALDLAGVGANLRDHQVVDVWWERGAALDVPADAPVVQVALRYTASGSRLRNDMKITIRNRLTIPGTDSAVAERTLSIVPGLELASGSGTLRIASSSADVQPVVQLNFLEEESDRARLREGVLLSLELAGDAGLGALVGRRLSPADEDIASAAALDDWLMRSVRTSHHICGTCKMGPAADEAAVVDRHGRLHGIENLRVGDASICPDVVRANLNATTMMIGERIADFMRA